MGSHMFIAVWIIASVTLAGHGPVNALPLQQGTDRSVDWQEFCQWTDHPFELRSGLSNDLAHLKIALNGAMDVSERFTASYMSGSTSSSQEQITMSRLTSGLVWIHQGLTCMGRALDIHCHPHPNHPCPLHPLRPRLYRHIVLPDNAIHLRTRRLFRQRFYDAMHLVRQLRASLDSDNDADVSLEQIGNDCEGWGANPAMVLSLSFAHVSVAQGFLEQLSSACDDI